MHHKSPNIVSNQATSHPCMRIFCSSGSSKQFNKSYFKIEDWPISIRISRTVLRLEHCWKSTQIIKSWKEWNPYAPLRRITGRTRQYCARRWKKSAWRITSYRGTFILHYRERCFYSSSTCMSTYHFTFLSNNLSSSSAFWVKRSPGTLSSPIHLQNRSSMKWSMRAHRISSL